MHGGHLVSSDRSHATPTIISYVCNPTFIGGAADPVATLTFRATLATAGIAHGSILPVQVSKSTQISVLCTFAFIWFGPSPMPTGTTTSADFLTFVVTTIWLSGSPRVRITDFPLIYPPFLHL